MYMDSELRRAAKSNPDALEYLTCGIGRAQVSLFNEFSLRSQVRPRLIIGDMEKIDKQVDLDPVHRDAIAESDGGVALEWAHGASRLNIVVNIENQSMDLPSTLAKHMSMAISYVSEHVSQRMLETRFGEPGEQPSTAINTAQRALDCAATINSATDAGFMAAVYCMAERGKARDFYDTITDSEKKSAMKLVAPLLKTNDHRDLSMPVIAYGLMSEEGAAGAGRQFDGRENHDAKSFLEAKLAAGLAVRSLGADAGRFMQPVADYLREEGANARPEDIRNYVEPEKTANPEPKKVAPTLR